MITKKNYKENIKIKDLAYLNELGAEIVEFYPKNDQLIGKLYVTGNYHSTKSDIDKLISQDIPFTIVFDNSDFLVEDIDCTSFDYNLVEGLGVEINYEITVDYTEEERIEVDNIDDDINQKQDDNQRFEEENSNIIEKEIVSKEADDEIPKVINEDETVKEVITDSELIKEEITNSVDQKLSSKLESSTDNLPQNEEVIRNLIDEKSIIKVIYYQNDRDLNQIAIDNKCSLDNLFRTNKQNDFSTHKRVIIKNGKQN